MKRKEDKKEERYRERRDCLERKEDEKEER